MREKSDLASTVINSIVIPHGEIIGIEKCKFKVVNGKVTKILRR